MGIHVSVDVGPAIALLRQASKAARKVVRKTITEKAAKAIAIAQPITPKDDENGGELRASLRHTRPTVKSDGTTIVTLIAGGGETGSYALIQHEDLTLKHTEPGTGPKFLERAAIAIAPEIPEAIEAGLAQELGS